MKNFERYKTADERFTAHDKWCSYNTGTECRLMNDDCEDCVMCTFKWLDMEYDPDLNHKKERG